MKGPEDANIGKLKDFFKESGITKEIYKNGQEPALCSMITEELKRAGNEGDGRPTDAVMQMMLEWIAVGESASNWRAERIAQTVEDILRTCMHALDSRIEIERWP